MIDVKGYLDSINAPWGKLFYRLVWHSIECEGKRILDFGSGFGVTADHFAQRNEVTAVEPNEDMLQFRYKENMYIQLHGGIEALSALPSGSFDLIICHNVLEYVADRKSVFREFERLLKPDGVISLVKHNRAGKVMQKAVFENNIDEAMHLINMGKANSVSFGTIDDYENGDIVDYCDGAFVIDRIFGIRIFFALQRNEFKTEADWCDNLFRLEHAAQEIPVYRDIAFFHHLLLRRA